MKIKTGMKLIIEYDFLKDVRKKYDNFDKPIDDDGHINTYEFVCHKIMQNLDINREVERKFCLKLVRNLGCYPLGKNEYFDPKYDRCKILHYWLYNSVKNQQISNNLITDCFVDYKGHMSSISITAKCPYNPYEENFIEPMNMIILDIFQSNINIIIDIVTTQNYTNPNLQNYICECINIYKEMYKSYCRNNNDGDEKRKLTCNTLNTFRDTYKIFLSATQNKNYNIPSIDYVEEEYTNKCLSNKLELPLNAPKYNEVYELSSLPEDIDERKGEYSPPLHLNGENHGSSVSSTVSTAVGTMAGASSILALLYKVKQNFI
ncbi:hypothetical protein PVBG_05227 [Plasmodium vivax Brazil I]|uniref:Uncharacterized protein n=1 Tax=Plasmodium vivax (strain Brazil I) TaxID=1033975 RepID=A0A0J9SMP0_PLAV1|nr:hypothetical protein PVBG_05227 [Plasmodium vivax Brazil I]